MTFLHVVRVPAIGLALVLGVLAACGGDAAPSSPAPADTPTAAPATLVPTAAPTEEPTGEPVPTDEPTAEPTGEPTGEPTPSPTPTPRRTAMPDPAAVCTGSAENRAFYDAVASQVTWDVYCPVLPAGWFVDTGNFRLAAGGRLEIAYRGPGGARLEIRQGAYCGDDPDCIPAGPDAGTASFGDRPARLVDLGGGRWLIVAEGGTTDWEVRSSGLARDVAVGYAADFVRVGR